LVPWVRMVNGGGAVGVGVAAAGPDRARPNGAVPTATAAAARANRLRPRGAFRGASVEGVVCMVRYHLSEGELMVCGDM
jgi:hypothetical protein